MGKQRDEIVFGSEEPNVLHRLAGVIREFCRIFSLATCDMTLRLWLKRL